MGKSNNIKNCFTCKNGNHKPSEEPCFTCIQSMSMKGDNNFSEWEISEELSPKDILSMFK